MLVKYNNYILKDDKDFYILLRIGLWQRVEEPLSESPDWSYIYTLACEQTVQGIIADGIGLYRKATEDLNSLNSLNPLNIPLEWNDKFLSASAQIVRRNYAVNQLQARICKLFNEQEVRYVVMKGQAVAQYYPKPNLRCSGDIDFYMDDENYERAVAILKPLSNGGEEEQPNQKHVGFFFDDLEVELHADEGENMGVKKSFKKILAENVSTPNTSCYKLNGVDIYTATPTFHAFYLFFHLNMHFFSSELGLRQLCDWTLYSKENEEKINYDLFFKYLSHVHLKKSYDIFDNFSNIYIQNNPNEITTNTKDIRYVWIQCKNNGNFGRFRKTTYNEKKIYRLITILKDNIVTSVLQCKFSPRFALHRILFLYFEALNNTIKKNILKQDSFIPEGYS